MTNDELICQYLKAMDEGRAPSRAQWLRDHSEVAEELQEFLDDIDSVNNLLGDASDDDAVGGDGTAHQASDSTQQDGLPGNNGNGQGPELSAIIPDRTLGRFKLLECIGQGSSGSVWKALDSKIGRQVAIKLPHLGRLASDDRKRLLREARAAGRLQHPYIVRLHEVGETDGVIYLVSDFVEGATLSEWIADRSVTTREATGLCAKLAEAIQHAHEAGVIHRDLKPANVLIDRDEQPLITDFGLAKFIEQGEQSITLAGQVIGTPAYMAPEQASGDSHRADARSDVYALGGLYFCLLTGERPFRGDAQQLIKQVLVDDPPNPASLNGDVSKDQATVCLKCLEKDPARRYATALDLSADLQRLLNDEPIQARPIGAAARTLRWMKRKPVAAILVALVAGLAVIGPLVAVRQNQLRRYAEASQKRADEEVTRANRATQRETATKEELRQRLYCADMDSAYATWDFGNMETTFELLGRHHPGPREADHRRFEWRMLWGLSQPEMELLEWPGGENDTVAPYALALSPDGQLLASATEAGRIVLWNLSNRQVARTLLGHTAQVEWFAFSPDGKQLSSASYDGNVGLWDVASGELIRKLKAHHGEVWTVAYSPDGTLLASGGADKTIRLWEPGSGKNVATLQGHTGGVNVIIFFPDGRTLASGSVDYSMRLWDVPSGDAKAQIRQPSKIHSFAISPDGSMFAVAQSHANEFRVYDIDAIEEGKDAFKLSDRIPHTQSIHATRFSPDGRLLATGSRDRSIRIWEIPSGRLLDTLRGHESEVAAIEFTADSNRLVSSGDDNTLRLWDLSNLARSRLPSEGKEHSGVTFSPDGRLLVHFSRVGRGSLWDVESGTELRGIDTWGAFADISPDGKVLALGLNSGDVELQDISTGEVLGAYSDHRDVISDIDFSPGGDLIASASEDGTIVIRRLADGAVVLRKSGYYGWRGAVEFFADGKTVAWANKTMVKITDLKTGNLVAEIPVQAIVVAISPDGKILAIGSWGGRITLWDVSGPQPQLHADIRDSRHHIYSLSFTPDSKVLVSGNEDGIVRFWDVASGEKTGFLRTPNGIISSVACSPRGEHLAVASNDGTLRLWRVDTIDDIEKRSRRVE